MRIESFGIYSLTNGAHFAFVQAVLARANSDAEIMKRFPNQVANLQAAFDFEDLIMLRHRKNFLTDDMTAKDTLRDQLLSLLTANFRGYMHYPDPEKQAAAKVLYQVYREYGPMAQMQYDRESGMLTNFCQDLTCNFAPQVRELGLTEVVAQLEQANNDFIALLAERTESWSGHVNNEMKDARAKTDQAYYDLRTAVNGFAIVFGDLAFQPFIQYMNAEIRRLKVQALHQGGETAEEETEKDDTVTSEGEDNESGGSSSEGDNGTGSGSTDTGSGSTGTGSESTGGDVQKYTVAWYLPNGNPIIWYELAPGDLIPDAPECPEGYYWHPYPSVMPSHDLDIIPEPIK